MTRSLVLAGLMTLTATSVLAQTTTHTSIIRSPLLTRPGHELNLSLQHYDYTEPDPVDISIHGPKFGAEYTGTFELSQRRGWFARLNVRGTGATADYDGNCRPWFIAPDNTSANGYRLGLGARFPCSEDNDADWYVDGRATAIKDFVHRAWAISPFAGIGGRHLSNGVTGNWNYRTQEYLYAPLGVTLRTAAIGHRVLDLTVEYDHLLRGWNTTRNSLLGGGTVPATETAPSFVIGGFTDLSFKQRTGMAWRASASLAVTRSWSIEPYYVRWRVENSTINSGSVAYTVNGITARRSIDYLEPLNVTNEAGVKIGLRFGGK